MQTINIPVVDLEGRDRSRFLESVNELYPEPPIKSKRISEEEQIQIREKTKGTFAKIRVHKDTPKDEIQLCFFFTPPDVDGDKSKTEFIWEILLEGAAMCIFAISGNQIETFDEAQHLIRRFREYINDLPLLIIVYDAIHMSDDSIRSQLNEPEHCQIIHFAPDQIPVVRSMVLSVYP